MIKLELLISEDAHEIINNPKPFIEALLLEGAKYYVGKARGATQTESPLYRHFVRTNRTRYKWKPLSERYADAKRRKYGAMPIMVRTGRLKDQALSASVSAKDGTATVKFTVPDYAPYHLGEGVTIAGRPPRRHWFEPNDEDEKRTVEFIDKVAQRTFDGIAARPASKRLV